MSRAAPGVAQCPRLVYRPPGAAFNRLHALAARLRRRAYGEPYQCGLLWGHTGECTWFTPGGYLPPPLITPLALLDAGWNNGTPWLLRCPLCGDGIGSAYRERTLVVYGDAENAERDEIRWEIQPCGCEGREFLPCEESVSR